MLEKMNRIEDRIIFPRFLKIMTVEFNEEGFRAKDSGDKWIPWHEVEQVAILYEIHPIAIADWDWVAFRLKRAHQSVWVTVEKNESFVEEIARRFAPCCAPAMKDWKDDPMCIRTYTIWPEHRVGEPLYVNRRRRWWSPRKLLAFEKRT